MERKCECEVDSLDVCAGCNKCAECCECEVPLTLSPSAGVSMAPGVKYPPGFVSVMGQSLRSRMDDLTGGPVAQAQMRQQMRDASKVNCGGSPIPAGPAWYDKP